MYMQFSKDGNQFVTMGKDRQIRIFKLKTGKLYRKYDESLAFINKVQKVKSQKSTFDQKKDDEAGKLDGMEFGRRMTVEKEIDISAPPSSVVFDDSGNFIVYPTMLGIKSKGIFKEISLKFLVVVNTYTNKVVKVLGKNESSTRFLVLALYQGKTLGSATTENLSVKKKFGGKNDRYSQTHNMIQLLCALRLKRIDFISLQREIQNQMKSI